MYLNQCWKCSQRHKLAFWTSWLNGLGGFVFFVSGLGCVIPVDVVQSTLYPLGYLIGSVLFLGGSVGALMMWKLNQFGYVLSPSGRICFCPFLNIRDTDRVHGFYVDFES